MAELCKRAVVLGKNGGDRKSDKSVKNQPDNVRLKEYGNSAVGMQIGRVSVLS